MFTAGEEAIDSVRLFNQQVRLWIEALAKNEKEKALASEKALNISFTGGGSKYTNTVKNSRTVTETKSFEFLFEETLGVKFGAKLVGVGVENTYSLGMTQNRKSVSGDVDDESDAISFTLSDNSEWDDFTVDVYAASDHGGPIFKTLGGRSSCPYEGTVRSRYYQPGTISVSYTHLTLPTTPYV